MTSTSRSTATAYRSAPRCGRDKEERKGEGTLCSECFYGKASRSFTLRGEVDEGKADARYQDGVLELVLPKKAGTAVKQLAVK